MRQQARHRQQGLGQRPLALRAPRSLAKCGDTAPPVHLHSARIKIDNKSLFKLVEIIKRLARRLNKTHAEQKQKFLMALPQQLSHIRTTQVQNRAHIGYVFPGNYPPYFPIHLANNAHPFAGQPDIEMLCKIINPEFLEHVNETTGYAPVRAAQDGSR